MSVDEKSQNEEVRASLEAEFDKISNETPDENVTDPLEKIADNAGRDEKGRFKPKDETVTQLETEAVEETPALEDTDQGQKPEAEPVQEAQPIQPPVKWSAEWKTKFAALPRDAQEVLLARESEYDKGFTEKAQEAANLKRQLEPIEQVIAPRRQAWAMQGMNEQQAVSQLLALSDFAATKPQEFLTWFASQRGIDLKNLNPVPAQQVNPEYAPIMQEVNSLKQTIQTQQHADITRQITAFKSAPGHEHFEDVRNDMAALMNAGIASDMQDAYDRACRVNPTVLAKIESEKAVKAETDRKAVEAKRVAEAKAAAQKAQKAAGTQLSTKGSLNGGVPAATNVRESMTREYDRLHGAA
jgi:hypothetical protein